MKTTLSTLAPFLALLQSPNPAQGLNSITLLNPLQKSIYQDNSDAYGPQLPLLDNIDLTDETAWWQNGQCATTRGDDADPYAWWGAEFDGER